MNLQAVPQQRIEAFEQLLTAVSDFVSNMDNGLIEGAREMPLRCDASFLELRKALSRIIDVENRSKFTDPV